MRRANKVARYLGLLLGLVYSAPGDLVLAAEIKIYPDAGPTRYYDFDNPISDCAGNPVTPQCALDTWESCLAYQNVDHCESIGVKDMVFVDYTPPPSNVPKPKRLIAIRPIKMITVEDGDIPADHSSLHWMIPGDVEIVYQTEVCEGGKPEGCTWEEPFQDSLFFKPENGHWHLIAWYSETVEDPCMDLEDPYGAHCGFLLSGRQYVNYVRTFDPTRSMGILKYGSFDLETLMELKKP